MFYLRIKFNFVEHLRVKLSEKSLAQRFDVVSMFPCSVVVLKVLNTLISKRFSS